MGRRRRVWLRQHRSQSASVECVSGARDSRDASLEDYACMGWRIRGGTSYMYCGRRQEVPMRPREQIDFGGIAQNIKLKMRCGAATIMASRAQIVRTKWGDISQLCLGYSHRPSRCPTSIIIPVPRRLLVPNCSHCTHVMRCPRNVMKSDEAAS